MYYFDIPFTTSAFPSVIFVSIQYRCLNKIVFLGRILSNRIFMTFECREWDGAQAYSNKSHRERDNYVQPHHIEIQFMINQYKIGLIKFNKFNDLRVFNDQVNDNLNKRMNKRL